MRSLARTTQDGDSPGAQRPRRQERQEALHCSVDTTETPRRDDGPTKVRPEDTEGEPPVLGPGQAEREPPNPAERLTRFEASIPDLRRKLQEAEERPRSRGRGTIRRAGVVLATAFAVAAVGLLLTGRNQAGTSPSDLRPPGATPPAPVLVTPGLAGPAASARSVSSADHAPGPPAVGPQSQPAPTGAPLPTSTGDVAATPVVAAAASQPDPGLRTVLDERFVDQPRGWPADVRSTTWLAGGAYHLFAREPGQFVAVGAPIAGPLRDPVVTATFRKVGGPPGGGYGLIVRDQGPGVRDGLNQRGRFYVLEVGDRGEVGIWRREDDRWVDLLPWTRSEAVRPGDAPNELRVHAMGPRLTFLVNGIEVASVEDLALDSGGVGVFVGGDFNDVVLEGFVVEVPR